MFDQKVLKITFPTKSILMESLIFNADEIKKSIEKGYKKTDTILKMLFQENMSTKALKYRIAQINIFICNGLFSDSIFRGMCTREECAKALKACLILND